MQPKVAAQKRSRCDAGGWTRRLATSRQGREEKKVGGKGCGRKQEGGEQHRHPMLNCIQESQRQPSILTRDSGSDVAHSLTQLTVLSLSSHPLPPHSPSRHGTACKMDETARLEPPIGPSPAWACRAAPDRGAYVGYDPPVRRFCLRTDELTSSGPRVPVDDAVAPRWVDYRHCAGRWWMCLGGFGVPKPREWASLGRSFLSPGY